jgi:uncharacterized protein
LTLHLTVIAKEPIVGLVKTRLCPPFTHEQAAELAQACLADTFDAVLAEVGLRRDVRAVALIDGEPGAWIPSGVEVVDQRGDGLAERLANGFDDLGTGVIIGMDTPGCGRWLGDALDAVRAGVDTIGLTVDGGYWGIGLASIDRSVFDDVPMSTTSTGVAQLRRLHRCGRPVRLLPMVHDLDTVDDIDAVRLDVPRGNLARFAAQLHT